MELDHRKRYASTGPDASHSVPTPGKRTLTQGLVQMHPAAAPSSERSEPATAPPPRCPAGLGQRCRCCSAGGPGVGSGASARRGRARHGDRGQPTAAPRADPALVRQARRFRRARTRRRRGSGERAGDGRGRVRDGEPRRARRWDGPAHRGARGGARRSAAWRRAAQGVAWARSGMRTSGRQTRSPITSSKAVPPRRCSTATRRRAKPPPAQFSASS